MGRKISRDRLGVEVQCDEGVRVSPAHAASVELSAEDARKEGTNLDEGPGSVDSVGEENGPEVFG